MKYIEGNTFTAASGSQIKEQILGELTDKEAKDLQIALEKDYKLSNMRFQNKEQWQQISLDISIRNFGWEVDEKGRFNKTADKRRWTEKGIQRTYGGN